jgi:hypothetical protein
MKKLIIFLLLIISFVLGSQHILSIKTNGNDLTPQITATSGGNVISNGGATVTARGVCWGISANPLVSGSHTTDGDGNGIFSSLMTGLLPNTLYYVRAYATNSAGTGYGGNIQFTTSMNSWKIYPNPAKTYFTIQLVSGTLPPYVKIYSNSGRLVFERYIGSGITSIVININLKAGTYIVCLDSKRNDTSWKQLNTNIILIIN